jgi:DNA-binding MarR family transcriptional regulator
VESLESPARLINKLAHAVALEMDRKLRAYDVTLSQWGILKHLWQQEGRSQVELQRLVGLERATVNGLVQRMARSDLIQLRPDPFDKRVQRIFLTERGRALQPVTASLEEEVNAWVLEGFSCDERTFFTSLLRRAFDNATEK